MSLVETRATVGFQIDDKKINLFTYYFLLNPTFF